MGVLHQLPFQDNDFTGDRGLGGTGVSGLMKGTLCANSPWLPSGELSRRASPCDSKQQLLTVGHGGHGAGSTHSKAPVV